MLLASNRRLGGVLRLALSTPDYLSILLDMVERLVRRAWSVQEFESHFYRYFLDEVPENALDDRNFNFFCRLQESLEWCAPNPDRQSRDDGWGDHSQYVAWATRAFEALRTGQDIPFRW